MAAMTYPWQASVWEHLESYLQQDRLPHALLLSGAKGLGKRQLARELSFRLLCETKVACGRCGACRLLAASTHPDLIEITPETGKPLTVDRIRGLIGRLELKSQYDRGRVVLIDSADQMNVAAANSFLKTLEEPADDTVIILVCEMPGQLPATILSRCQHLKLAVPPAKEAIQWLQSCGFTPELAGVALGQVGGAPLAAKQWLESDLPARRRRLIETMEQLLDRQKDPVILAASWQEADLEPVIVWLQTITADFIRLAQGGGDRLLNPDCMQWLQSQVCKLNLRHLHDLWQRLLHLREGLHTQLNRTLLLESLFITIYRLRS